MVPSQGAEDDEPERAVEAGVGADLAYDGQELLRPVRLQGEFEEAGALLWCRLLPNLLAGCNEL